MEKGALVLMIAVAVASTAAMAQAQIVPKREIPPPAPDAIAALEKRVAVLEQQNAELRRFVVISGDTITVKAQDGLNLEAMKALSVRAGTTATLRASTEMRVEAAAALRLRGATINFNGGSKPLARVGDPVQVTVGGTVATGAIQQGSATLSSD